MENTETKTSNQLVKESVVEVVKKNFERTKSSIQSSMRWGSTITEKDASEYNKALRAMKDLNLNADELY